MIQLQQLFLDLTFEYNTQRIEQILNIELTKIFKIEKILFTENHDTSIINNLINKNPQTFYIKFKIDNLNLFFIYYSIEDFHKSHYEVFSQIQKLISKSIKMNILLNLNNDLNFHQKKLLAQYQKIKNLSEKVEVSDLKRQTLCFIQILNTYFKNQTQSLDKINTFETEQSVNIKNFIKSTATQLNNLKTSFDKFYLFYKKISF